MSAFGLPDQPAPPLEPACVYCRRYESTGHDPLCFVLTVEAYPQVAKRLKRWPPAR